MRPSDHFDLFVTSLETSLGLPARAARLGRRCPRERDRADPDAIELELVHRPGERDLAERVGQLTARLERLEQARA